MPQKKAMQLQHVAENLSNNIVVSVCTDVLALTQLVSVFEVFPGCLSRLASFKNIAEH